MIRTGSSSAHAVACLLLGWLASSSSHAEALTEDGCSVALAARGDGEPLFKEIPGFSILHWDPTQPLKIPGITSTVTGILCWRSAARFADNDYVVALAGLPLYIKTDLPDPKNNRTLVLEGTATGFRVRQLEGPALTKAEQSELQQLVKRYKAAQQQRQPAPAAGANAAKSIH